DGFAPATGQGDLVIEPPQAPRQPLAVQLLVVHHQDGTVFGAHGQALPLEGASQTPRQSARRTERLPGPSEAQGSEKAPSRLGAASFQLAVGRSGKLEPCRHGSGHQLDDQDGPAGGRPRGVGPTSLPPPIQPCLSPTATAGTTIPGATLAPDL